MKFDDLPFAGQIALIAVLCAGLGFVFYQFLYSPQVKAVNRMETELAELQQQINRFRPFVNRQDELRQEIEQIKQSLEQLENIFPSIKNDVEIKRFVESIAEEYDIDIASMRVGDTIDEVNYLERRVNYQTRGRTIDYLRFFDALARRDQVVHIYGLQMTQNAGGDESSRYPVEADFSISSYVYKPLEEVEGTDNE
jgi:Tfp pilus assembly protein PilO